MFSVHHCVFLFYRLFLNTVVILAIWQGSFVLSTGKSHVPCFVKQAFSCWIMFPIFSQSSEYLYDCKTCYYWCTRRKRPRRAPKKAPKPVLCALSLQPIPKDHDRKKNQDLAKQNEHFDCRQTKYIESNITLFLACADAVYVHRFLMAIIWFIFQRKIKERKFNSSASVSLMLDHRHRSKVPARDRPVEETTRADMRNNNNRSRPTIAIWTQELATFTKSMWISEN